ncbi:MAG: histidinol-phosphate transaminase [Synergistaceae bacterium]|nr:histidinol-phosphate transaminase [Synergistaceae bacterium]
MGKFLHTKYSSLTPYDTSGEVESMKGYIRLNTNESPFPPSPKVLSATLEASRGLNYYCDPECSQIAAKIASMYSLSPSQIVFGNGSDEILNFLFMAFCEKGAAFPNITYSFYKILAKFHGVDYIPVPLKNFRVDPSYYKDVKGRTIFIANPNAPTSLAMSLSEIEEILSSNPESLVVIDEAYVDFGAESAVTLLPEHDNLVITRTFSKSRSLAGARLGWCMTSEEIAKDIKDIKNTLTPYNINAMTQAAGLGALDDEEYTRRNIDMIRMVRDNTKSRLREMGFDVMDSSTNFLFAKHETVSGEEIFNTLKKYRIMIRHFSNPPAIADYNRITIGTPEQMQIFLEVTKGIIKQ